METINIAVKELVNFLFSSGDLESKSRVREAQKRGQEIHEARQKTYLEADKREVFIAFTCDYKAHTFKLNGRIDGLLIRDDRLVIEEIKSTATAVHLIDETTYPAHLMQAVLYAYMYLEKESLETIDVWLHYVHSDHHTAKTIKMSYSYETLKARFYNVLDRYIEWLLLFREHYDNRTKTLEGLTFPHKNYREGQEPFMAEIYRTLIKQDILYATAPTGIGKTIAALYSGLKTLSRREDKLFYLTAKNVGKTVAVKTVEDLKNHGLKIKSVTLNSKEHMCLQAEVDCDPDLCPFAKGFYNRVQRALKDIFIHDDIYDAELMKQYGKLHTVCPHEFALTIAEYADVVLCDFNYVFDPRIKLLRFFEESLYKPKLLVDEAHNLVDRSRAMYSASLSKSEFLGLYDQLANLKPSPRAAITAAINAIDAVRHRTMHQKVGIHIEDTVDEAFILAVEVLAQKLEVLMVRHKKHAKRKVIREGYFLMIQFLRIYEHYSEAFRFIIKPTEEDVELTIYCLDASTPLLDIFKHAASGSVLFSATLTPTSYFKTLLTKNHGRAYEIPSPFNPKHLGVFADIATLTKYRYREFSVTRIIDTLYAMLESKKGNYIVFFPSYAYMQMVLEAFDASGYIMLVHHRNMSLFERQELLKTFQTFSDKPKIMFSVLGGSFSEGVDYVGEMLSGVCIVGVALPQFNPLNELLKDYFYQQGLDGFDFAYTYPGMHKVIQAVGRVIRTETDRGIAVLLDTRYALPKYQALFPAHWDVTEVEEDTYISDFLRMFWQRFVS